MSAGIHQRMKGQGNQGMFGPSFGQQSSYNYFPNNGDFENSFGSHMNAGHQQQPQQQHQQQKRGQQYDDYYRGGDKHGYDGVKSLEHGMQDMGLDQDGGGANYRDTHNTTKAQTSTAKEPSSVPKKMTWASIASQPAKPQIRANSSSSTLKKKGPGMPPPPMVPGKHNMDIGTWDSPKNGSAIVPPPPVPSPPPVNDEPSPLSQQHQPKSHSGNYGNSGTRDNIAYAGTHRFSKAADAAVVNIPSSPPNSDEQYRGSGGGGSGGDGGGSDYYHGRDRDGGAPQQMQRQNWHGSNNSRVNGPPHAGGHYQSHHRSNYHHGGPSDRNHNHYQQSYGMQRPSYRTSPPAHYQQQSYNSSAHSNRRFERSNSESESMTGNNLDTPQARSVSPTLPTSQTAQLPATVCESNPDPTATKIDDNHPVLEELVEKNNYNPEELDLEMYKNARFFIIKSYSEDDIHRSIKYEIWCSTEHGNKRLDQAFRERSSVTGGSIYLLFSVNGSGHFCGVAQMMTAVDYNSVSSVWHQDKWKGQFKVKWIYVKDVPNPQLRHIRLENNENKPVTNSRDTQEVPNDKGLQVLDILHAYKHITSIFDDFIHYEKRQVEEGSKKVEPNDYDDDDDGRPSNQYHGNRGGGGGGGSDRNHFNKGYRSHFKDYRSNFKDYRSNYNNHGSGGGGGGGSGEDSSGSANKMSKPGRNYSSRGGFMSRDRDSPRADKDDFNRDGNRGGYDYRDRMDRNGDRDGNRGGYDYRDRMDRNGDRDRNRDGGGYRPGNRGPAPTQF